MDKVPLWQECTSLASLLGALIRTYLRAEEKELQIILSSWTVILYCFYDM